MAKKKYPSELNTRHIRVNVGDYALLKELSIRLDVTIAALVHDSVVGNIVNENNESQSSTQIPMPVFRVTSKPTIAVNGSKAAAFGTKLKGVRYE